jgi:hypothetical protein
MPAGSGRCRVAEPDFDGVTNEGSSPVAPVPLSRPNPVVTGGNAVPPLGGARPPRTPSEVRFDTNGDHAVSAGRPSGDAGQHSRRAAREQGMTYVPELSDVTTDYAEDLQPLLSKA